MKKLLLLAALTTLTALVMGCAGLKEKPADPRLCNPRYITSEIPGTIDFDLVNRTMRVDVIKLLETNGRDVTNMNARGFKAKFSYVNVETCTIDLVERRTFYSTNGGVVTIPYISDTVLDWEVNWMYR